MAEKTVFIDARWIYSEETMTKVVKMFKMLGYQPQPIDLDDYESAKARELAFMNSDLYYIHDYDSFSKDFRYQMAQAADITIWNFVKLQYEFIEMMLRRMD